MKGYNVYKNGHFYHFCLSLTEAQFCVRETQKEFPQAKLEIKEEKE